MLAETVLFQDQNFMVGTSTIKTPAGTLALAHVAQVWVADLRRPIQGIVRMVLGLPVFLFGVGFVAVMLFEGAHDHPVKGPAICLPRRH